MSDIFSKILDTFSNHEDEKHVFLMFFLSEKRNDIACTKIIRTHQEKMVRVRHKERNKIRYVMHRNSNLISKEGKIFRYESELQTFKTD